MTVLMTDACDAWIRWRCTCYFRTIVSIRFYDTNTHNKNIKAVAHAAQNIQYTALSHEHEPYYTHIAYAALSRAPL